MVFKRLFAQIALTAIVLSMAPMAAPAADAASSDHKMRLVVTPLQDEVVVGSTAAYRIFVENKGKKKGTVDIEATLDDDLEFVKASGSKHRNHEITWKDITLKPGKGKSLLVLATVLPSARGGDELRLEAEMDGDDDADDSATIAVLDNRTYENRDPILRWNAVALHANLEDFSGTYSYVPQQGGPTKSSYALGVVHAAMYEAENSIDKSYQPYLASIPVLGNKKPSIDAAVATAAHETLVFFHPAQRIVLDGHYQQALSEIPDSAEKSLGMSIGMAAAAQTLAARVGDGYLTSTQWTPSPLPGRHRPDPINPTQSFLGNDWGGVRPFLIQTSTQFRAPAPPALNSPEYAAAFNETKSYGGNGDTTSTIRTAEQTDIGVYWAYDGVKRVGTPPRFYNQIVRIIAEQKGNTVAQNARLFALVNLAMADAGIACWESKYYYDYWRPVVGIREADAGTGPTGLGDGNPATTGDPAWTPYGAPASNGGTDFTPPFPSYPSGHATFGAAAFKTVANFYGTDNIAFTAVSDELNGVTTNSKGVVRPLRPRSFSTLSQATRENAQSRIYLGVHWQFDATSGIDMGTKIADYAFANKLQPVR